MQKRRVQKGGSGSDLPITMSDAATNGKNPRISRIERRLRRQNKNNSSVAGSDRSCLLAFGLFALFLIILGIISFGEFEYTSHHPMQSSSHNSNDSSIAAMMSAEKEGPEGALGSGLSQFSSLKYALDNAEIVGLYFAASWCPMSTPVTNKLNVLFSMDESPLRHEILSPLEASLDSDPNNDNKSLKEKKKFALVFISSDDTEEDMIQYSKRNWINVPFDSTDKDEIKRHFRICAQTEMEKLGIERRREEIPSLVIIDGENRGVLSITGTEDLEKYNKDVLEFWLEQKKLLRFLVSEYQKKTSNEQ